VELFVADELETRFEQLGAHHEGEHAAEQEHEERRDQVEVADHLVVGGRQPRGEDPPLARPRRGDRCARCVTGRCHLAPPAASAAFESAMNLSYSSGVTTLSWNSIRLWLTPQSSAQRPS